MSKESPVLIFDGNNTAFRSAAVLGLKNEYGGDVSVPFGVLRSVRYAIKKLDPLDMVVVWDGGRAFVRKAILPIYKETEKRAKTRADFEKIDIWESIKETQVLLSLLGVPQIKYKDTEADDIIALYADMNREAGNRVVIISSDKDFYQLICDGIEQFDPMSDKHLTIKNFGDITKTGLTPSQYLEYQIMLGDRSDNIPGIEGVGKKTALDLIMRYGSVDKAVDAISNRPKDHNRREQRIIAKTALERLIDNRILIDLRSFRDDILTRSDTYHNECAGEPRHNYTGFLRIIAGAKYNFKSILQDDDMWLMPFRKLSIKRSMRND